MTIGYKYLWLLIIHFLHLYKAASAVYRTYDIEEECLDDTTVIELNSTGPDSTGVLQSNGYSLGINCTITLRPPPGHGVVLSIRQISLRKYDYNMLYTACQDYIVIYSSEENQIAKLCDQETDLTESLSYYSTGNLSIQFFTDVDGLPPRSDIHIEASFTAVLPGDKCSQDDMVPCNNSRCIWAGLTCDGRNNCGDKSDEGENHGSKCFRIAFPNTLVIIVGTVASLVVLTVVVTIVFYRRHYSAFHFRKSELLIRHNLYPTRSLGNRHNLKDKESNDNVSLTCPSETSASYGPLVLMVPASALTAE